ncbi:hypothetical protein EDF28_3567 [Curtobacterium sp. PhB137]|uniref:helix-turn-helix domain-containing protein n=1 Tax=Curtobacterium sp. PhB137 TaxID=2485182 RepID=UPI000F4DB8A4|nr:helix-turn-helix transcriptional regulator [Curtobacterium sp. PhB137]RPE75622.1 hypothetical protein EDF28_3567 [Curtobacterium sp. PhB137]
MSVDDEQIGKNFTRLRGDLSQKEVAELMRARGFRWSQATVWSIEKGERPLRLSEAQAVVEVLGQPFFDLTADDGEAVVDAWMRECSNASKALEAAVDRFEQARMQLALTYRHVEGKLRRKHEDGGGWLRTTVEDVVREHRERDRGDESLMGQFVDANDPWLIAYNETIEKEYPSGERPAAS